MKFSSIARSNLGTSSFAMKFELGLGDSILLLLLLVVVVVVVVVVVSAAAAYNSRVSESLEAEWARLCMQAVSSGDTVWRLG